MAPPGWIFVLDAAVQALAIAIYLAVGNLVAARPVSPAARTAARAFASWWWLLALLAAFSIAGDALGLAGAWDVALLLAFTQLALLVAMAAIACLLYFLVYLYTGRGWLWKPIGLAYLLYYGILLYAVAYAHPVGLQDGPINPALVYERDLKGSPWTLALGLALTLPIIVGALAYLSLFLRTKDPTPRYRIAVTSMAILAWFSFSTMGTLAGIGREPLWIAASRLVSLGAATAIYLAYRPPAWVRRKWGVQGLE